MKVLFIGDIVGRGGRRVVLDLVPKLISKHDTDLVVANGENAAGGFGITPKIAEELLDGNVDLITTGNHIWDKKEIFAYLEGGNPIIRPGNYPPACPGSGSYLLETAGGERLFVLNASGRIFMENLDCPFRYLDGEVENAKKKSSAILVDFHAEATSEKRAIGKYLDGRVSAVVGTHTHVQTSDNHVTSNGTGYITDVGMTGATDSIIGMKAEEPLHKFITGMPVKFETAKSGVELQGVLLEIDGNDGRCISIERIKESL
jgi:hypothetical protein